jgi:hypothetical protein
MKGKNYKVHKWCARILLVNKYQAITHWIVSSFKITKETNLDHQTQQSHWPEKIQKKLAYTKTYFIELKIMIPFYHLHWSSQILTNPPNLITHLIISSVKIFFYKNWTIKSNNFNIVLHTYTQTYPTPFVYLLIHINIIILVSIQITLIILLIEWKACLKFWMSQWYIKINKLWLCVTSIYQWQWILFFKGYIFHITLLMIMNCFKKKDIYVILVHILGRERCIYCLWSLVDLSAFVSKHIEVFGIKSKHNVSCICYCENTMW